MTCLWIYYLFYWIEVKLMYNIVLISVVPHSYSTFKYISKNDHHSKSSNLLSPYKFFTVLSTIFLLLYLTSTWLIVFSTRCLCLLITFTYFASHTLLSGRLQFALSMNPFVFSVWFFRFHIYVRSYGICLSLSNLFDLT